MAFISLVLNSNGSTDDFKSQCPLAVGGLDAVNNFISYLAGIAGGAQPGAQLTFEVGGAKASGTLTVSSTGSANDQTCNIAGITFTAKTSGATGNQFNISATPATQAENMVAAFNASADLAGKVVASRLNAIVTITAVQPGVEGNAITLSAGTLANVALGAMSGGSDGTSTTIDLR